MSFTATAREVDAADVRRERPDQRCYDLNYRELWYADRRDQRAGVGYKPGIALYGVSL
jgi:hypothetical protein